MMPTSRGSTADESPQPSTSAAGDLIRLLNLTLRQARLVAGTAVLFGAAAFLSVLTQPRTHTATASFLLQPPKLAGNMPGIAAQLGLSLPTSDPGQSPAFYAEMIRSRSVLSALADSTFTYRDPMGATITTSLAEAYRVRAQTPTLQREAILKRLDQSISVRTSLKSGVVAFSVRAPAAELAPRIATAVLGELSYFNMQRRQSQAAAERRFTGQRLAEVASELRAAEDALEAFLRRNRSIAGSPQLTFEQERLSRAVDLRRTLNATMAQSYEQARIEEVRDTPQLTIVQNPEVPARPDSRFLIGKVLVAAAFGALVGLLLGFSRERLREAERQSGDEIAEFTRLREAAVEAVRRRFRFGRRRLDQGS